VARVQEPGVAVRRRHHGGDPGAGRAAGALGRLGPFQLQGPAAETPQAHRPGGDGHGLRPARDGREDDRRRGAHARPCHRRDPGRRRLPGQRPGAAGLGAGHRQLRLHRGLSRLCPHAEPGRAGRGLRRGRARRAALRRDRRADLRGRLEAAAGADAAQPGAVGDRLRVPGHHDQHPAAAGAAAADPEAAGAGRRGDHAGGGARAPGPGRGLRLERRRAAAGAPVGAGADRAPIKGSPAVESSRRMGLPDDYLYRRRA